MSSKIIRDPAPGAQLRPIALALVFGLMSRGSIVQGQVQARATQAIDASAGDSLQPIIAAAVVANPTIAAANHKVAAAKARIGPAGSRSDPMLMFGVENVPINPASLSADDMTMKVIGVEQTLPYPGKLSLRRRVAALEATAFEAAADSARLAVVRNIKKSWYSLAYTDAALDIAQRNHVLLTDVVRLTTTMYSSGTGSQQDVLRARLEAARINKTANSLREERQAITAQLNALLDRPSTVPVPRASIPAAIVIASVDTSARSTFASSELGASVTDSPLRPLHELQDLASKFNPELRAMSAMVDAASVDLQLSRKDYLPDFDVSLQYGQRSGRMEGDHGDMVPRPDMITAMVSIPIPLQKSRKQNALASASRSTMYAAQADEQSARNRISSEVSRTYSEITHQRTLIALIAKTFLTQARATVASALNSYQSGSGDLNSVLAAQTTLLDVELSYERALTEFASKVAELEALVGKEVLR